MTRAIARLCIAVPMFVLFAGINKNAQADPIRIAPFLTGTWAPIAGSLHDNNGDGIPDSGGMYMTVLRGGPFESRAFAEYDVRGLDVSRVRFAWFEALVQPPTSGDPARVHASMYVANGRFDDADYSAPAADVGYWTAVPGTEQFLLTLPLHGFRGLLRNGAAGFVGLRFDAVNEYSWVEIGGFGGEDTRLVVETVPTPEPASVLLVGTALALTRLLKQRRA